MPACSAWRSCQFGPEDNRGEASADVLGQGQRRSKVLAGESIKVGCQYRTYVSQTAEQQQRDVATVSWPEHEHKDRAGKLCHGPDAETSILKHKMEPFLSPECKRVAMTHLTQNPEAGYGGVASGEWTLLCVCVCGVVGELGAGVKSARGASL